MSRRNSVHRAYDAFGKRHFTEKRSGSWFLIRNGVEQTLNLQKSQYGLRYYLNVLVDFGAVVPPELSADASDSEYPCAIKGRVEDLLADPDGERLDRLLDVDGFPMPEERREHELLGFLEEKLAPRLGLLSSLEAVVEYDQQGAWRNFGVYGPARRVLDAISESRAGAPRSS
jgi:hypothetical protein